MPAEPLPAAPTRPRDVPALLLSAGSEVTTVALADELLADRIPLIVVALGQRSLLRDVPGVVACHQLPWPPDEDALDRLTRWIEPWLDETPLPAFATDDGSLRFLVENRQALAGRLAIPGIASLPLGGLDKAELETLMRHLGLDDLMAPSAICETWEQVAEAVERFGPDVVFKPAMKRFDMALPSAYCKVVTRSDDESVADMLARLERSWPLSTRWIAQVRLQPHPEGEAVFCGARGADGTLHGFTAFDRWKQPRLGGTGCWVETQDIPELAELATTLLDRLDLRGLAEVAFLQDAGGRWRLLEINARAWLQVGLGRACGLQLATATYRDALGEPMPPSPRFEPGVAWVSPERLLLSVFSSDYGPWWREIIRAASVVRGSATVAMYSSDLPRIKRRWLQRCLGGLVNR